MFRYRLVAVGVILSLLILSSGACDILYPPGGGHGIPQPTLGVIVDEILAPSSGCETLCFLMWHAPSSYTYIIVLGYITAQSRVSCDARAAVAALVCDPGCVRL